MTTDITHVPPSATRDRSTGSRRVGDLLLRDAAGTPLRRPGDVGGPAAWQALVRDGVLTALRADVGCAVGTPVDPHLRAEVLRDVVPTGAVVTGRTAGWVHTGAGTGAELDLACRPGGRRPARPPGARLWQAPLLAPDVRLLGGVPVTTPLRTAVELALHDDSPAGLLAALAAAGVDLDAARRAVLLRPRVGAAARRSALAALGAAQRPPAGPPLTRAGAPAASSA